MIFISLFNVEHPIIFYDEITFVLSFNEISPPIYQEDKNVELF